MNARSGHADDRVTYDVAFSFAGEDRSYVRVVAASLKTVGVTVFFDEYEKASLWGKDLYAHLSDVYRNRSRFTVMFISRHYAQKLWTNHERRSAQEKAFMESREYLLPVRFDDTEIPGIPSTVGYIDASTTSPEQLADLLWQKIRALRLNDVAPPASEPAVFPVREYLWPVFELIEQAQAEGTVPGISSGMRDLDLLTGGWRRDSIVVITGSVPDVRNFAFHCAFRAAFFEEIPSLILSARQLPFALTERSLSWASGISTARTRSELMTDGEYAKLAIAAGSINTKPMYFATIEPRELNLAQIVGSACSKHEVRLLVVDGLEMLSEHTGRVGSPLIEDLFKVVSDHGLAAILPTPKLEDGDQGSLGHWSHYLRRRADFIIDVQNATEPLNEQPLIRAQTLLVLDEQLGTTSEVEVYSTPMGYFFSSVNYPNGWPSGAMVEPKFTPVKTVWDDEDEEYDGEENDDEFGEEEGRDAEEQGTYPDSTDPAQQSFLD